MKTYVVLMMGLAACGYSGVVTVGSQAVVLRDGFFGAVRTINSCGVNDAGLTNCKLAEDKELTAGNPNAPAVAAPEAAPKAAEPPPPPAAPAPVAAEPAAKPGKAEKGGGKAGAKEKPAKGKKKKK